MRFAFSILIAFVLLGISVSVIRLSNDRMAESPYTDPADGPVIFRAHDRHAVDPEFKVVDGVVEKWSSASVSTQELVAWLWFRPRHELDLDALSSDDRQWVIRMDASGSDGEAVRELTRQRVAEVVGFRRYTERRTIRAHELRVHEDGLRLREAEQGNVDRPNGHWGPGMLGTAKFVSAGSDMASLTELFGLAIWSDVFPDLAWVIDATGLEQVFAFRFEFQSTGPLDTINRELRDRGGLALVPVEREVEVLVFEPAD